MSRLLGSVHTYTGVALYNLKPPKLSQPMVKRKTVCSNLTYFRGVNFLLMPLPHSFTPSHRIVVCGPCSDHGVIWSFGRVCSFFILAISLVLTCGALSDVYLFFGGNLIHEKMLFIGFTRFVRGRPKALKTNPIKAWNRNTTLRRGHKVQENRSSILKIKHKWDRIPLYKCWLHRGSDLDVDHCNFLLPLPTFLLWE